jgi:hypothetical protein
MADAAAERRGLGGVEIRIHDMCRHHAVGERREAAERQDLDGLQAIATVRHGR